MTWNNAGRRRKRKMGKEQRQEDGRYRKGTPGLEYEYYVRGEWLTVREFADRHGMRHTSFVNNRLREGWSVEEAFTRPPRSYNCGQPKNKPYTCDGLTMTIPNWARHKGMTERALRERLYSGWPEQLALRAPKGFRRKKAESSGESE